jgi:hypothetical protein
MKNNRNFIAKKLVLLLTLFAGLGLSNMVLATNNYALNEVIDVLIIYDTPAEQYYGSKERTELAAQHFITATNTYWRESGGHFAFNLAGVVKKDMNEMGFSKAVITQLENAKSSRTYMSELLYHVSGWRSEVTQEIRNLRKIYEADLVVLISDGKSSSVCGRAFMAKQKYLWPSHDEFQATPTANSNFFWNTSVMKIGCGALTFAHEAGHNLGLGHSRKQGNKGSLLEAGVGYGIDDLFSTIMAYQSAFNLPSSGRISRFSNPDKLWGGVPTGVAGFGEDNSNAVFAASGFAVPYVADLTGPSCDYTYTKTESIGDGLRQVHRSYYVSDSFTHRACLLAKDGRLPLLFLEKWDSLSGTWKVQPAYQRSNRVDESKGFFRSTESGFFRWVATAWWTNKVAINYTIYMTLP